MAPRTFRSSDTHNSSESLIDAAHRSVRIGSGHARAATMNLPDIACETTWPP